MKSRSFRIILLATTLALVAAASASAQATRTWVSGVGDDVNPCSRTAPCKTFAGAISETATGGEISVLDAGGFGAVTITKSITISADGQVSSVLDSGSNGVVVNAPAGSKVTLRGLEIEGAATGVNGVRFIGGGTLVVDHCRISNHLSSGAGNGIDFQPNSTDAELIVTNTDITHNGGSGIVVRPAGVTANVTVQHTRLANNNAGLRIETGGIVTADDVFSVSNTFGGFNVINGGKLNLVKSTSSHNQVGVRSSAATVRVSDCTVTNNSADGLVALSGGSIVSFGDNKVAGNTPDGAPTSTTSTL